jgi:hypothetical protein
MLPKAQKICDALAFQMLPILSPANRARKGHSAVQLFAAENSGR